MNEPIPNRIDEIGRLIVDAAYTVHKKLGPGLLERIYETCFCHELSKRGLSFRRQVHVPLEYDGHYFEQGVILDVLVEDAVICELKAQEPQPVFISQLLSQLKLARKRLGYLINFNVPLMKNGIRRMVI